MIFSSTKKEKEYNILKKVFKDIPNVTESETPDFIIDSNIGVEIVNFYHSEVSAMLKNDKRFKTNVCEKMTFKKKKFCKFAPMFVKITSNFFDTEPKRNVMITNYPEKIKNIIFEKNKLDYFKKHSELEKIYLIIQDAETLLAMATNDKSIKDLFNIIELNACKEVFSTKFEKIYFVIGGYNCEYFFDFEEMTFLLLCHLFEYFYFKSECFKNRVWKIIFENLKIFLLKFGINHIHNSYNNTIVKYKEYKFELFKNEEIDFKQAILKEGNIGMFIGYIKENVSTFEIDYNKINMKKVI